MFRFETTGGCKEMCHLPLPNRFFPRVTNLRNALRGALAILFALLGCLYLINQEAHAAVQPYQTKFGIFYAIAHCPFSEGKYDTRSIVDIQQGIMDWGAVGLTHWWGRPAKGFYCLAERPDILAEHAVMLRDAGFDFVYVDATNQAHTNPDYSVMPKEMILDPFSKMLEVWSQIPGAPKIVPWAPITTTGDMMEELLRMLDQYPHLRFFHEGKQLIFVTGWEENPWVKPDLDRIQREFSPKYMVRRLWGYGRWNQPPDVWAFIPECEDTAAFKRSQGIMACNQNPDYKGNEIEHLGITTAYHKPFMSRTDLDSIPKFYGRTFMRQMETLYKRPTTPIVTIADFNGWNVGRFCESDVPGGLSGNPAECRPGGDDKIFFDYYNDEYSRDIEPELGGMGSFYFDLVKSCVLAYKRGERCTLPQPSPKNASTFALGDYNGDRISDYADQYVPDGSFWIHLGNREGRFGGDWALGRACGKPCAGLDWRTLVADFTGDKRADYADYLLSTGQVWIHKNVTKPDDPVPIQTPFDSRDWTYTPTRANNPYVELLVGDFTGDGEADIGERNLLTGQIFIRENRTQGWMGFEYVNSGSGFRTMAGPDWTTIVADFNGDGLADIADLQLSSNIFWVHLNRGASYGFDFDPDVYVWAGEYGYKPNWKIIVGDFNGDGKADYARMLDNGTFEVHLNTGDKERGKFNPAVWRRGKTYRPDGNWHLMGE